MQGIGLRIQDPLSRVNKCDPRVSSLPLACKNCNQPMLSINSTNFSTGKISSGPDDLPVIEYITSYDADSASDEHPRFENPTNGFTTKHFDSELTCNFENFKITCICHAGSFLTNSAKYYCESLQKSNTPFKRMKKPNVRFKPRDSTRKSNFYFPEAPDLPCARLGSPFKDKPPE